MRMGLWHHLLVVRKGAFDEPRQEKDVGHPEDELVLADRDLDILARAHHARDLLHGFARDDARDLPARPGQRPHGQGQPVAVGGHEPDLPLLHGEEDAVQGIAALVVGDGEGRLSEHVPEELAIESDPRRRFTTGDGGEIGRAQSHELVRCASTAKGHPSIVLDLQR